MVLGRLVASGQVSATGPSGSTRRRHSAGRRPSPRLSSRPPSLGSVQLVAARTHVPTFGVCVPVRQYPSHEVDQLAGGLEGRRLARNDVLDPAAELVRHRFTAAAFDEKCPSGKQDLDVVARRAISTSVLHTGVLTRAAGQSPENIARGTGARAR